MTKQELQDLIKEADFLVEELSALQKEASAEFFKKWETDDPLKIPEVALMTALWANILSRSERFMTRDKEGNTRPCDMMLEIVPITLAWALSMGSILSLCPKLSQRLYEFTQKLGGDDEVLHLVRHKALATQLTDSLHSDLNRRLEELADD